MRVGLLGVGSDDDFAVEHRARRAIQHAFVELAAHAPRFGVVDARMVIYVLPAISHVQAVERSVAALRVEARCDVVARKRRTEGERAGREMATLPLSRMNNANVKRAPRFLLQLAVLDLRALLDFDPRRGIRQSNDIAQPDVVLDDRHSRSGAAANHRSHMNPRIGLRADEQQVNRLVDRRTGRDVDVRAIGPERSVEHIESRGQRSGILSEQRLKPVRVVHQCLR